MKNKIFLLLILVFVVSSCNENDKTDQEWKKANEQAYDKIKVDSAWNIIDDTPPGVAEGVYYKIVRKGEGEVNPLQTASVKVLYKGYYYDETLFDRGTSVLTFENVTGELPEKGEDNVIYLLWEEDKYTAYHWLHEKQEFEAANYEIGSNFLVNSVVRGFSIALQNMVVGDKWEICIPYNLGYGSTGYISNGVTYVKSYSTLFFEVELLAINQVPL
jgi:FKBP-type peptidyl-prolyl cis-trans isomerase